MSFLNIVGTVGLLLAVNVVCITNFDSFQGGAINTVTQQDGFLFDLQQAATPPQSNTGGPSLGGAANLFGLYGFREVSSNTEAATAAGNSPSFSFGNLLTEVTGESDNGKGTVAIGTNQLVSATTPDTATTQLYSNQNVFANGPGETAINFFGSGQSLLPGSTAGFAVQGSDTDDGKNPDSTVIADGISLVKEGFSLSNSTICAGSLCN